MNEWTAVEKIEASKVAFFVKLYEVNLVYDVMRCHYHCRTEVTGDVNAFVCVSRYDETVGLKVKPMTLVVGYWFWSDASFSLMND